MLFHMLYHNKFNGNKNKIKNKKQPIYLGLKYIYRYYPGWRLSTPL